MEKIQDNLVIQWGHWFEFEDYNGNFCCEPKDDFHGKDADISRGQSICYASGYTWQWADNRRSEAFGTNQAAFDDAFDHLFVQCPKPERTEIIYDWLEYARDHSLSDRLIMEQMRKEAGHGE